MEEVAHVFDQRLICQGKQEMPFIQYWKHLRVRVKHLFEEFRKAFHFSPEVAKKCHLSFGNSPSRSMFENLRALRPRFAIIDLKDSLKHIQRNDLVKELEQCSLSGK